MKLPEKEWLTLEEVAEKWRTDVEYLKHCLITGKLKPCLRQGRDLLQIENYHNMQWEWSWKAEASFCDLAKCKIQLTCKDVENVRWSGDREVCEDDLLITLSEVKRFEKACNADTDSYFEAKRLRKQQTDVLPSVSSGGRPPEYLMEALNYAYLECRDRGDTSILEPGQLQAFLKRLQKLSGGSRNKEFVSEYIKERIELVQPSDLVECVKTHERAVDGKLYKKGDWYSQSDISTRMNTLRKKHPLPQQESIQELAVSESKNRGL